MHFIGGLKYNLYNLMNTHRTRNSISTIKDFQGNYVTGEAVLIEAMHFYKNFFAS